MARDTYKYILKKGNKIVYVGITNNLDRRIKEHETDKSFTKAEKIGNKTTRDAAKKWEENRLHQYRRTHRGSNPDYNFTNHG